jgi:4-amino-4-deoxy-L-arabinose transferase-like glycosyltransferase
MGCEMFHSWGFVFLRTDALVYVTHFFFSIILTFFSCFILYILCFQDKKAISGTEIISYLIIAIMLLLFPPLWDMQFNQIGKNDIAMSAFIMAAVCYLLQCINKASTTEIYGQNILLMGIALGIVCAIKPNGLYCVFYQDAAQR